MDISDFEDHLDRLGGELDRWPPDLRRRAAELLAVSAEARALKAAMGKVEACLRKPAVATAPSPATMAVRAMRRPQVSRARVWTRAAACGAATAAALLLGVVVGDFHADQGELHADQSEFHEDSPDQVLASVLEPAGVSDVD